MEKKGEKKSRKILKIHVHKISINGQKTESLNQVTNIFKELETGEEVTLKISTEEKEAVITFQKPEAKARKIIRKERN